MTPNEALILGIVVGSWIASMIWVLLRRGKETGSVWLEMDIDSPKAPRVLADGRMVKGITEFTLKTDIDPFSQIIHFEIKGFLKSNK
jgi:hypothetical protein